MPDKNHSEPRERVHQTSTIWSVLSAHSHTRQCRVYHDLKPCRDSSVLKRRPSPLQLHCTFFVLVMFTKLHPLSLLSPFCCFTGYDVPAAPGAGLPAFAPRGSPWPEAPEYPGDQRRTDQIGRLWSSPHLQLSDGAHLCGELCCSYFWTQWDSSNRFLQQRDSK